MSAYKNIEVMDKPDSIFEMKVGMRVYDSFNNKYGRVSDIKETHYEWIEPFVLWDDSEQSEKLSFTLPNIHFVRE